MNYTEEVKQLDDIYNSLSSDEERQKFIAVLKETLDKISRDQTVRPEQ